MSVAIVGAGLAGVRLCESLRQQGFSDPITLIGAERHPPYTRPPLSKELLRGDVTPESASLLDSDDYDALGVTLRLGEPALALSVADRTVSVGADTIAADHVVIATGVAARRLPSVFGPNVFVLRDLDDCLALQDVLIPGARVVVIGAGFIGLEVAASARSRECSVTVVDIVEEPLARVLDRTVGRALRRLHESHDVRFRLDVGVKGATVDDAGRVTSVSLTDGSAVEADVVVVGIGAAPMLDWLADSGLDVSNGIRCDATLSAAPGIWAIGDVARWPHPPHAGAVRIEHWTNAVEQAQHVATSIVSGVASAFAPIPYFWSDNYDAKLQAIGVSSGDEVRIVIGSVDEPKWTAFVRGGDQLIGVIGLRSPGAVMRRKPLLAAGTSWAEALGSLNPST